MNDTIFYKIQNAYMIPYREAIDEKIMDTYDKTNETIASSRIYLICRLRVKGFFLKKFSKPEVLYVGETFDKKIDLVHIKSYLKQQLS